MRTLLRDLVYSTRQLRRSPSFALTTMLTLTMAITANVVVFGVFNALLLHSLPVPQPQRVFQIEQESVALSYPNYRDLRDRNRTFSSLAVSRLARIGMGVNGVAQPVWGYEASGNYFEALGITPRLGRFFGPADDVAVNGSPAAVLSYACWQARFNGDPAIIGKTISVSKHPYVVLGVAPQGFSGTERFIWPEIWVPFHDAPEIEGYSNLEERAAQGNWVIGRLRDGVTAEQASADLQHIAGQLSAEYPKEDRGITFHLAKPGLLGDVLGKPVQAFLTGVLAMALLVLLAACANLGALFSSRTADRSRELGIRLAIGATRLRILQQLVLESTVISILGGAFASLISFGLLRGLSQYRPPVEVPIQFMVEPGWQVFLFAVLLALVTGLLFGLVPARQVWRTDPNETLKASGSSTPSSRSTLRSTLLVVQIALCCLLVTASLVALRGLQRTFSAPFGFRPQGVTVASLDVHVAGYSREQQPTIQKRLLEAISSIPGVDFAAYANTIPLSVNMSSTGIYAPGSTVFDTSHVKSTADYFVISPGYFSATGTKLLAGRAFNVHDDAAAPRVAIINQTFAHRIFGTDDVIGKRYPRAPGKETEVVGLVEDGKYQTLTEDPAAAVFWPILQAPESDTTLLVRSSRPPEEMVRAVHQAILEVDSGIPIFNVSSWPDALGTAVFPARAATVCLGVLGALAIMLAFTGVFGMATFTVSRRMRELGIRSALGADGRHLLDTALGRVFIFLVAGSFAGLLLGLAASRLLSGIVYSASASDPWVICAATGTMILLGLMATALPAWRALKVNPALLMRE